MILTYMNKIHPNKEKQRVSGGGERDCVTMTVQKFTKTTITVILMIFSVLLQATSVKVQTATCL